MTRKIVVTMGVAAALLAAGSAPAGQHGSNLGAAKNPCAAKAPAEQEVPAAGGAGNASAAPRAVTPPRGPQTNFTAAGVPHGDLPRDHLGQVIQAP